MSEVEPEERIDPKLSYVLTYFNNPDMMKLHIATWHTYPKTLRREINFIVVDDCSTPPLHIDTAILNLTVLRIKDDIVWNLPGARNLGADYCKTDWFLMGDTDMLLTAEHAQRLVDLPRNDPNRIWGIKHTDAALGKEVGNSANMMLLSKKLFWRCWGYDEDYSGSYGGQEGHLRSKLFREGGVRSLEHNVRFTNFGEDHSPRIVADAMSSVPEMKTDEGMARSRNISERLYWNDPASGQMRTRQWNKSVLRFEWEVAQEFHWRDIRLDDD